MSHKNQMYKLECETVRLTASMADTGLLPITQADALLRQQMLELTTLLDAIAALPPAPPVLRIV
jgi:hypothetical protein